RSPAGRHLHQRARQAEHQAPARRDRRASDSHQAGPPRDRRGGGPPRGLRRARARRLGAMTAANPYPDMESWAAAYVRSSELAYKLAPAPAPRAFRADGRAERIAAPGRPPELRPARRGERTPRRKTLEDPQYRARALHAFFHHELQAAELMCW